MVGAVCTVSFAVFLSSVGKGKKSEKREQEREKDRGVRGTTRLITSHLPLRCIVVPTGRHSGSSSIILRAWVTRVNSHQRASSHATLARCDETRRDATTGRSERTRERRRSVTRYDRTFQIFRVASLSRTIRVSLTRAHERRPTRRHRLAVRKDGRLTRRSQSSLNATCRCLSELTECRRCRSCDTSWVNR